jgi:hypothetical protein
MGRRSKNQAPLPLEAPVRVRLSDEDRARKGHELAVIGLSIRGHKRKLTSDNRATKAEIARLEKDRGDLEDALIADEELRPQGQLFVDGTATPTPGEAAAALAAVAAVAGEVKPSEPHAFEAVGGAGLAGQMCKHCGSGKDDPVHPQPGPAEASAPASGNGKGEHPETKASPAKKARPQTSARKAARP